MCNTCGNYNKSVDTIADADISDEMYILERPINRVTYSDQLTFVRVSDMSSIALRTYKIIFKIFVFQRNNNPFCIFHVSILLYSCQSMQIILMSRSSINVFGSFFTEQAYMLELGNIDCQVANLNLPRLSPNIFFVNL